MALNPATSLLLAVADGVWSLFDDFAPSRTLREVANHLDEVRRAKFDASVNQQEVGLKARASALRRTLTIVSQQRAQGTASAADEQTATELVHRLSLIDRLLDMPPSYRDSFGGTIAGTVGPEDPAFRPLAAHASSGAMAGEALQTMGERVFGSPDAQRREGAREARISERAEVIGEMRRHLADAAVASDDGSGASTHRWLLARLDEESRAVSFVARALPSGSPPHRPTAAATMPPTTPAAASSAASLAPSGRSSRASSPGARVIPVKFTPLKPR